MSLCSNTIIADQKSVKSDRLEYKMVPEKRKEIEQEVVKVMKKSLNFLKTGQWEKTDTQKFWCFDWDNTEAQRALQVTFPLYREELKQVMQQSFNIKVTETIIVSITSRCSMYCTKMDRVVDGFMELIAPWVLERIKNDTSKWNTISALNLAYMPNRHLMRKMGFVEELVAFMVRNQEITKSFSIGVIACLVGSDETLGPHISELKEDVIDMMMDYFHARRVGDSYENSVGPLWNAALPVSILVKADRNKKNIAKSLDDIVQSVTGLDNGSNWLQDPRSCKYIFEILAQLTFLEDVKKRVRENDMLMKAVQEKSISGRGDIAMACKSILWNVRQRQEEFKISEESKQVMISYNWSHQDIAIDLSKRLKDAGFNIWIDVEKMSGSTLGAMADAVESSCLILMLISKDYKNSANCRIEGEYVCSLKKKFIPIIVEEGYKADGWLGAMLGTKLWYILSSGPSFENNLKGILKAVSSELCRPLAATKPIRTQLSLSKIPLTASCYDVANWLKKSGFGQYYDRAIEIELDGYGVSYITTVSKKFPPEEFMKYLGKLFPGTGIGKTTNLAGFFCNVT